MSGDNDTCVDSFDDFIDYYKELKTFVFHFQFCSNNAGKLLWRSQYTSMKELFINQLSIKNIFKIDIKNLPISI